MLFWLFIFNGGHSCEMFAFNQDLLFVKVVKLRVTISSFLDSRKFEVFRTFLVKLLDSAFPFQFSLDKNFGGFEYI